MTGYIPHITRRHWAIAAAIFVQREVHDATNDPQIPCRNSGSIFLDGVDDVLDRDGRNYSHYGT